jgi:hypothetical protein
VAIFEENGSVPVNKLEPTHSSFFLLVYAIFGYPCLAIVGDALNIGGAFWFRSLYHVVFIFLASSSIYLSKSSKASKKTVIVKIVSTLFLVRLCYSGLYNSESVESGILPWVLFTEQCLVFILLSRNSELKYTSLKIILVPCCIVLVVALLKILRQDVFAENFSGRGSLARLDPISLGMFANASFAVAFNELLKSKASNKIDFCMCSIVLLLSVMTVALCGSRGPFLIWCIYFVCMIIRLYKVLEKQFFFVFLLTFFCVCLLTFALSPLLGYSLAVFRFGLGVEDGDLRSQLISNGFEKISTSPVYGAGIDVPLILGSSETYYSHSVFVDMFLYFGIPFGFIIFLLYCLSIFSLLYTYIVDSNDEKVLSLCMSGVLLLGFSSLPLIWSPAAMMCFLSGIYSLSNLRPLYKIIKKGQQKS